MGYRENKKFDPAVHHRRSIRLKGYDYSQPGAYFVTICVQDHECMLGEIKQGWVGLSSVGEIAQKYWMEIPAHYPQVSIDDFVIMPNHIHGIIVINENHQLGELKDQKLIPGQPGPNNLARWNTRGPIGVENFQPQRSPLLPGDIIRESFVASKLGDRKINQYQHIIPESVGSIIRAYKAAVTLWCRRNGYPGFKWQRDFYEHIVRNDGELQRIRVYIVNNPVRWKEDKLNRTREK
jgi:REP element-mobilizing transposase RayT